MNVRRNGKDADATPKTRCNIELPTELLDRLELQAPGKYRTAAVAVALQKYLDSTSDAYLATHFLELDDETAIRVAAYRAAVDNPPISNIARPALNQYITVQLEQNAGIRARFNEEEAKLRRKPARIQLVREDQ